MEAVVTLGNLQGGSLHCPAAAQEAQVAAGRRAQAETLR